MLTATNETVLDPTFAFNMTVDAGGSVVVAGVKKKLFATWALDRWNDFLMGFIRIPAVTRVKMPSNINTTN
jgi:hypothetical protein